MKLHKSLCLCGVLLAAVAVTASIAVNETTAQDGPYRSVFEAVMGIPEADQIKSMLVNFLTSPTGLTPPIVARYQYIVPIAQGQKSTITAFVPANKAYEAMQIYLCMTTEELNDYLATHPEVVADTIEQVLANTTAPVLEKDLKDGLRLPTFKKGFALLLKQHNNTNGTSDWVIPKMNFDGSDIIINTTDIPSGKAVTHLTNGVVSTDAQKAVYKDIAREYCGRPGAKKAAEASVAQAMAARVAQAQAPASPSPAPESTTATSAAHVKSIAAKAGLPGYLMLLAVAVLWFV